MNEYPPLIDDEATEIARAYSSFGNLASLYLGQSSAMLHLRLFPRIFEEAEALYLSAHPSKEHEQNELSALYAESANRRELFIARCQAIVEADPLWATMQGKRHTTLPESVSDPGYVAINNAYEALTR